jgi:hypothetical protein
MQTSSVRRDSIFSGKRDFTSDIGREDFVKIEQRKNVKRQETETTRSD